MAETKPNTTADQGETRKPAADTTSPKSNDIDAGAEKQAGSAAKPTATRPETRADRGPSVSEPATTTSDRPASGDQPSPTQAELDAMRENTLAGGQKRRNVQADGKTADYKTR